MNRFSIIINSILLLAVLNIAVADDNALGGLTQINRGTCLMFPEIPEAESLRNGFHYTVDRDEYYMCHETEYDYICEDVIKIFQEYRYKTVTKYEYYSASGALVTTSEEVKTTKFLELEYFDTVGEWKEDEVIKSLVPQDESAKAFLDEKLVVMKAQIEHKIEKLIFDSFHETCEDSFYK